VVVVKNVSQRWPKFRSSFYVFQNYI
jgi:hypothetical protein